MLANQIKDTFFGRYERAAEWKPAFTNTISTRPALFISGLRVKSFVFSLSKASAQLSISPSPIKHKQVVLHEPLDIKKHKQELAVSKLNYNMALIKFDENTLKGVVDLRSKRTHVTSGIDSDHLF